MKYVDFDGHHYGIYITYKDAYLHAILVENKLKVCTLTVKCYKSQIATNDYSYAYVDVSNVDKCEEILNTFGVKRTGNIQKAYKTEYVEFDFKKLVNLNDKEMKRDKITHGMIEITENMKISTQVVYYAYHSKKTDEFYIITTDGWKLLIDKALLVKAVKAYNIPVYKQIRKEPYDVAL